MKKPSEINEIFMRTGPCKVSVCVITYNHELYIAQCLQSIIDQRCNFDFELIVRDDCSQDGTLEIIRGFQARYPEIIKLLDTEKNIGANKNILAVFSAARGKYLALCEGDDYWLDTKKLEKQLAVMESQPELTFTAHPCLIHDKSGLTKIEYVKSPDSLAITCKDVLAVTGQFAPTASYMFRRELLECLPAWFGDAPVGDFFIEMYAIAMGRGLYLSDAMSAYRIYSINSWTFQHNQRNHKKKIDFSEKMKSSFLQMQSERIFDGCDFSRKFAAADFNIAINSLLMKDFQYFCRAISVSRAGYPGLSLTQTVLYRLRGFPLISFCILKYKNFFHR